jgi:SRSO17 transposase
LCAPFRQGLTDRKLAWAVGIPRHLKVYPADVQMIWPVAGRGRPRQRHVPNILSMAAEDMLADARWRNITWRTGTKGKLKARFAAVRVRVADGPPQRIRDKGPQHLRGDEAWLIGEHRMSGGKKYYLATAKTDLRTLATTNKVSLQKPPSFVFGSTCSFVSAMNGRRPIISVWSCSEIKYDCRETRRLG